MIPGAWRTGSFKPVGDGFEDGVLFCGQKASALFWWEYYFLLLFDLLLGDEF